MSRTIISVIGPGAGASTADVANAYSVGKQLAEDGFVTLTGGRASGVMDAALQGAKSAGGETIAVLPTKTADDVSSAADYVLVTGLSGARNYIIALSGAVIIACGVCAGTASEISYALNNGKLVLYIGDNPQAVGFFETISKGRFKQVTDVAAITTLIKSDLKM